MRLFIAVVGIYILFLTGYVLYLEYLKNKMANTYTNVLDRLYEELNNLKIKSLQLKKELDEIKGDNNG